MPTVILKKDIHVQSKLRMKTLISVIIQHLCYVYKKQTTIVVDEMGEPSNKSTLKRIRARLVPPFNPLLKSNDDNEKVLVMVNWPPALTKW